MPRRSRLQVAAHNLAHMLASGLAHDGDGYFVEHLGWAAHRAHTDQIELDFLRGTVAPVGAATPALLGYLRLGAQHWHSIVVGVGAPVEAVRGVSIVASLALDRPTRAELLDGPIATVIKLSGHILDDAGAIFEGAVAT